MVLVGGVCVPACSSEDHVPDFQTDGQAGGCIFVGNCPFSLWGYNPSGPFELRFDRFRDFPARWVDDDVALEPLPAGGTATTVRHAVKCNQIFQAPAVDKQYSPLHRPGGQLAPSRGLFEVQGEREGGRPGNQRRQRL